MRLTIVFAAVALASTAVAAPPGDPWSTEHLLDFMAECVKSKSVAGTFAERTCGCIADTWRVLDKASIEDVAEARTRCVNREPSNPMVAKLKTRAMALLDSYHKCLDRRSRARDRSLEWDEAFCACSIDAGRAGKTEADAEPGCKAAAIKLVGESKPPLVGVPSCDRYIDAMTKCARRHMEPDATAAMEDSMRTMTEAWSKAASTPEGREALASGCKEALDAARVAYKEMGCTF